MFKDVIQKMQYKLKKSMRNVDLCPALFTQPEESTVIDTENIAT